MKSLETLYTQIEGKVSILSPAVGEVSHLPRHGHIVTAESEVGLLRILGSTLALRLPNSISGRVLEIDEELLIKPVGYSEMLFSLCAIEVQAMENTQGDIRSKDSSQRETIVLTAPSHGIFYRKPSPDAPAYVEIGSIVKAGQMLGLVEVMKCFNQIVYTGANLPETAKIVEICVNDGSEIRYQQPLFRFEGV